MAINILTYVGPFPVAGAYDYASTLDETSPTPDHTLVAAKELVPITGSTNDNWQDLAAGTTSAGRYRVVAAPISITLDLADGESVRIVDPRGFTSPTTFVSIGSGADTFIYRGVTSSGPFELDVIGRGVDILQITANNYDIVVDAEDRPIKEVTGNIDLEVDLPEKGYIKTYFNSSAGVINLTSNTSGWWDLYGPTKVLQPHEVVGVARADSGQYVVVYLHDNAPAGDPWAGAFDASFG